MSSIKILAVDPGLAKLGVAVISATEAGKRLKVIHTERLTTKSKDPTASRLAFISNSITELCKTHKPDAAVCEITLFGGRPGAGAGVKSALLLAAARGSILAALGAAGVPVKEVYPVSMKKIVTGNGHADKYVVEREVRKRFGLPDDLTLRPDEADALGLALCHFS